MYNNFFVEKKKKENDKKIQSKKRINSWLENYHAKVQPFLLDRYNQRLNNFITKVEQNPIELQKFQAADIKKEKQEHLKQKISELSRKGGKIFKFRDAIDFNSFFSEAQRIQRQNNRILFQKKYGDSSMAFRSIASQSDYNPTQMNQYRSRQKNKQINPPMRYTNKFENHGRIIKRKAKSVLFEKKQRQNQNKKQQVQDDHIRRRKLSYTNSFIGTEDEMRSLNSIKDQSQSSQQSHRNQSHKNLKKFNVTLQNPIKAKRKQSNKSYFVGITDIKQNSKDPHVKKSLHNILVKIGKTHPNPRDKSLISNFQVLSTEIN